MGWSFDAIIRTLIINCLKFFDSVFIGYALDIVFSVIVFGVFLKVINWNH